MPSRSKDIYRLGGVPKMLLLVIMTAVAPAVIEGVTRKVFPIVEGFIPNGTALAAAMEIYEMVLRIRKMGNVQR